MPASGSSCAFLVNANSTLLEPQPKHSFTPALIYKTASPTANLLQLAMKKTSTLALLIAAAALLLPIQSSASSLPLSPLTLGGQKIEAQIAASPADRQQGLMFRQSMPASQGMLFVFEQTALHCFWMKNTPLALTIGFFDERGTLINTVDMAPFDESSHCPSKPARYALEMNQGWFAKHKIKSGSKLAGQPKPTASTP